MLHDALGACARRDKQPTALIVPMVCHNRRAALTLPLTRGRPASSSWRNLTFWLVADPISAATGCRVQSRHPIALRLVDGVLQRSKTASIWLPVFSANFSPRSCRYFEPKLRRAESSLGGSGVAVGINLNSHATTPDNAAHGTAPTCCKARITVAHISLATARPS